MKGLLLKGQKQVEIIEEEIKETRENKVLIRIDNFNLCGSDQIGRASCRERV